MSRVAQRPSERAFSALTGVAIAVVLIVVLAPAVLTVVLSFSNDPTISFPPKTWGFERYRDLFESEEWLTAIALSLRLSLTSALIALGVGVMTIITVQRSRLPFRGMIEQASIVPMVLPVSAYAVAMFMVYTQLGIKGTEIGIVLMNAILGVPMIVILVGASLREVNSDVELVAGTLGASRLRALFGVTFPMILPAIGAGFIAAFQVSFEEAVFIDFLGGPGLKTLPKAISDSVRYGSDPVITAIAALIILVTTICVAIPLGITRGREHD